MKTRQLVPHFGAAAVLTLILSLALPAQSQTVLIDFGNNQSFRGTNVVNPDVKGHYWNSVWSGAYYPGLLTTNGTAGTWAFGFEGGGAGDSDSFNGPAGDTSAGVPATIGNCIFDSNALGDLGITNAVYDFYVNSRFQIQFLNPAQTYTLTFFGSHKFSASDFTRYSIYTNAAYSLLETSVTLFVQTPGDPSAHNSNTVVTVSGVKPASDGILYIQFNGTNTVNGGIGPGQEGGYLNCLKITQAGGSTNTPTADPPAKTVLIDFGDNTVSNGVSTASPDSQGHYWNSVHYPYVPVLTNAAGQVTTYSYGLDALTGADSYNGPAGDTSVAGGNLTGCVFNATALGYLGITNAVYDYFVTSAFQIQGADPTKQYKLTFFGSHKFNDDDVTKYSICTDFSYSTIITSVFLTVGSGGNHNQDTLAVLSNVSPTASGTFFIKFEGQTTQLSGYLNCMSIVDLSTNVVVVPPDVNKTILVDFGVNSSFRGTNTLSPDSQGHYWNNVGDSNSLLVAKTLTNAAGAVTPASFVFNATNTPGFGTDSYNGPAGPVPPNGPANCVFNPSALGYLGITNAVFDFYVNAEFKLQGLDPAKTYSLTFFGSHKFNIDNVTTYSVRDSTYTTVFASTNLTVGSGSNHNQDKLAVLGPISPQANGTIYIKFIGSAGNLGYLNCMQVVDLSTNVAPSDPFTTWQNQYFGTTGGSAAAGADPDGDGMSNTNEFLAGFNPTNNAAYPHIISIVKSNPANLVITYLGANGDSTWSPGIASRTNVLEFTTGTPNGSYSNNFASTGQTNVLSGGTGVGVVTSFIETNVVTGPARYYRVRVLVP